MEVFSLLADGFATSLLPLNIAIVVIGVTAGLFIGAMPGLGSVNGVAIVLPLTFIVPPTSAMILLAAIYYGAMYGGAISSILLGIPGASTSVATTFDGRPMAQQGKAGLALIAAAVASFVGGTISVILFTAFAVPLAEIALRFGPAENFALVLLAFTTFVGLGGDDILKTVVMICLGLVLATVGLDLISGQPRLVFFDVPGFYAGISFLVLAIGVYGVGEILWTVETSKTAPTVTAREGRTPRAARASFRTLWDAWRSMSIGSFLGFFVGMLPAAGATPASLMAYGIAKATSKSARDLRQGQCRGRDRAGDREQRRLDRRDAADADARHPGLADHGAAARRHGDVGADARTDAVHRAAGFRLGADLVDVHGERRGGARQPRADPALRLGAAGCRSRCSAPSCWCFASSAASRRGSACTTSG
jgi:putative tricarboxylic transport membrane protein